MSDQQTVERAAVSLLRRISPELQAFRRLGPRLQDWFTADEYAGFQHLVDDFAGLAGDLREAEERAKALQDEFAAKMAEDTNRNLFLLSSVSVAMLPMTFVTGFFGMNTGGMPFSGDDANGTLAAAGVILAFGAVTALALRLALNRGRHD